MKLDEVRKLTPVQRYRYWIVEREGIRLLREQGQPAPWTDDEILRSYRFCNVVRIEDKVSQWLVKNWYTPTQRERRLDHLVVVCALARLINLPETLAAIKYPWPFRGEYIKTVVRRLVGEGKTVYNPAYMIRGGGNPDKIGAVVDWYVGGLIREPLSVDSKSMQRTVEELTARYGFGNFMAGQVVADLRWAAPQYEWADRNDWAPIGPGSLRGMNRVQGRPTKAPLKQSRFLAELRDLRDRVAPTLPASLVKRMEMIDWQNTLCEADKYNRALFGEGKPKSKYNGA